LWKVAGFRNQFKKKVTDSTLAMVDEFVNKNPLDPIEEIFVRLEEKFADISCIMSLLMEALESKLELVREVGG
jgi:hypothetical protein